MLRIADEIYNGSPVYGAVSSTISRAIPNIDVPAETITKGGEFEPLKVTRTVSTVSASSMSPETKTVARTENTTDKKRYVIGYTYATYKALMALYHFYIMDNSLRRANNVYLFPPDEDLYENYAYYCNNSSSPLTATWYQYAIWPYVH